jgi:hypothetical protein
MAIEDATGPGWHVCECDEREKLKLGMEAHPSHDCIERVFSSINASRNHIYYESSKLRRTSILTGKYQGPPVATY